MLTSTTNNQQVQSRVLKLFLNPEVKQEKFLGSQRIIIPLLSKALDVFRCVMKFCIIMKASCDHVNYCAYALAVFDLIAQYAVSPVMLA